MSNKKQGEIKIDSEEKAAEALAKADTKTSKKDIKADTEIEQFNNLSKSGKKEKVEFLTSPTGLLKLGYSAGETASFTKGQADFLYDLGIAKKA
jgi:hypothetical protein